MCIFRKAAFQEKEATFVGIRRSRKRFDTRHVEQFSVEMRGHTWEFFRTVRIDPSQAQDDVVSLLALWLRGRGFSDLTLAINSTGVRFKTSLGLTREKTPRSVERGVW